MTDSLLHLAPDLDLPPRLITSTVAILARKGSGKSHALDVLAEELLGQTQQVVIFDPVGAHWGLRTSFDGTQPGYPVAVFGGDHAIAPLDPRSGRAMATAVIDHGFSAVFDVSNMEEDEKVQFGTDFFRELLRANRRPIMVGIDEAHTWAPQTPYSRPEKQSLSAVKKLVLQGRGRGIGVTLVSQRTQLLNKDIISQCDVLVNMRMSHPKDIAPVYDWLASEIDPTFAAEVKSKLSKLSRGEAYVCSNEFDVGKLVKFRQRRTFNSGRTPEIGDLVAEPTAAAEIDIAKLGQEIAASVEKAKTTDTAWLQAEVARLERLLAEKSTKGEPDMGLLEDVQAMQQELEELRPLREQAQKYTRQVAHIKSTVAELISVAQGLMDGLDSLSGDDTEPESSMTGVDYRPDVSLKAIPVPVPVPASVPASERLSGGKLPAGEAAFLTVLAQHNKAFTRQRLSILAGYTKRSTRDAYLQRLSQKQFIEQHGDSIQITPTGREALGPIKPLPTGKALLTWWLDQLPKGEREVLAAVAKAPTGLTRDDISRLTGYEARSTRDAYIQRVMQKGLIDQVGAKLVAAMDLRT